MEDASNSSGGAIEKKVKKANKPKKVAATAPAEEESGKRRKVVANPMPVAEVVPAKKKTKKVPKTLKTQNTITKYYSPLPKKDESINENDTIGSGNEEMEVEGHSEPEVKPKPSAVSAVVEKSLHQLMMNPNIITAGITLLQGLKNKTISIDEVGKRIGYKSLPMRTLRSNRAKEELKENDESKMASDPPDSHDVKRKSKMNKNGKKQKGKKTEEVTPTSDQEDEEQVAEKLKMACDDGEACIRQLMEKTAVLNAAGKPPEFFEDQKKKLKLVQAHAKTIQNLSSKTLKEYYAKTVHEVAEIYKGNAPSIRHQRFKQEKEKQLKDLNITHPFNDTQSGIIIDLIFDSFIPDKSKRYMWSSYVSDVLVPEVLLRIYAYANKLTNEMADNEMLYQERYEGPPNKHLSKRQLAERERLIEIALNVDDATTDDDTTDDEDDEDEVDDDCLISATL